MPTDPLTADWVRRAHGDAWQAIGAARSSQGGGAVELPGVRLSATGLPHAQWNNGDVDDPGRVDIESIRRWYSELRVPWGLRVPSGAPWHHGHRLLTKRLMGLVRPRFRPASAPPGITLRPASAGDLDRIVPVDAEAFEEDEEVERPWLQLLLEHPAITVVAAESEGATVGSGYVLRTDGRAGQSAYIGGIAVVTSARRRGVGSAISSWLIERSEQADLWHLHPDTDEAASIYRRLGFVEVDGLDIYVDA